MDFDGIKKQLVGKLHQVLRKQLFYGSSSMESSQQISSLTYTQSFDPSSNPSGEQKVKELSDVIKEVK